MVEYFSIAASIISVIFAVYSYMSSIRAKREFKKRYESLIELYKKAINITSSVSSNEFSKIQLEIDEILTSSAESLSLFVGAPIYASVYILNQNEGDLYATVLSTNRKMPRAITRRILIEKNTAFQYVLDVGGYFLSNDIQATPNYASKYLVEGHKTLLGSVLVIPLLNQDSTPDRKQIFGFLSLDSPKKFAFPKESVSLTYSVAALITTILGRISVASGGSVHA